MSTCYIYDGKDQLPELLADLADTSHGGSDVTSLDITGLGEPNAIQPRLVAGVMLSHYTVLTPDDGERWTPSLRNAATIARAAGQQVLPFREWMRRHHTDNQPRPGSGCSASSPTPGVGKPIEPITTE